MKKTIKLAVVAALALGATSAFATNGSNLYGIGVKSRAMGGVAIGMGHGAESGLSNPALITSVKDLEISFGGTIFMPDVDNTNNIGGGNSSGSSEADFSVIPEVSLVSKVNENLFLGIGMWGTAGMGTDYRETKTAATGGTQMQMVTNLQLLQFGVPIAYKMDNISVAITPLIQYGSLDINYEYPGNPNPAAPAQGTNFGTGVGQDLQFGYNLGLAYNISNLTFGAAYKSQIDMDYQSVLSKTLTPFSSTGGYTNENLSTPSEIGIGISYELSEHTFAIDYKKINWSDAEGYKDFDWKDQDVYALGYQYKTTGWSARIGYNYSKSPIEEQKANFTLAGDTNINSAGLSASTVNTLNLLGFPAITETHYTVGGSYSISGTTSVDLAYAYAPEVSESFTNFANQQMTVTHSQTSLSIGVNHNF